MATVDVVIPCYNYERYVSDCVKSVLDQPGADIRILIIDNCSTDSSLIIAQQMAARDSRIEVIAHEFNKGATFSYNEGIDWASSDYFLILDADDLLAPGALARAIALLESDPQISFTHGIEARLEPDGTVRAVEKHKDSPDSVLSTGLEFITRLCRTPVNNIGANTVVRRTSAQKKVGHYRASLPYTDDLEMWLRLATVGSVADIRQVQAIRRYHDRRMSVHYQSVQVRDFVERQAAFESFFNHEGQVLAGKTRLLANVQRGLGEHAYWSAVSHFCRGHRRTAYQLWKLSHERRPRSIMLPPLRWLLQMDRPLDRVRDILRERLSWKSRSPGRSGSVVR